MDRFSFIGSLLALSSRRIFAATMHPRIVLKQSINLPIGDIVGQDGGVPRVGDIVQYAGGLWASIIYGRRIYKLNSRLELQSVSFDGDGWAIDLVPMHDGSLYFRQEVLGGLASDQLDSIGRLDRSLKFSRVLYPDGTKITQISRLGSYTVAAITEEALVLYLLQNGEFVPAHGVISRNDELLQNLVTAPDDALWFVKGGDTVCRLTPNGDLAQATISWGDRFIGIVGLVPNDQGASVSVEQFVDRRDTAGAFCNVRMHGNRLGYDLTPTLKKRICDGVSAADGSIWFIDQDENLCAINPSSPTALMKVEMSDSDGPPCRRQRIAPFRNGVAVSKGQSIGYYAIAY